MKIANTTAVPTALVVSEAPGEHIRIGMLTAKATFKFDVRGRVALDTQAPVPLFAKDEATLLGILPTDRPMRRGPAFEVILLGHAYPPRRPATVTQVALAIGEQRRELLVWGDRTWHRGPGGPISSPTPFENMPLVYERAFGGKVAVTVDEGSIIDLRHAINPRGKGYNAETEAAQLCQLLKAPKGYPILPSGPRPLPNIEDPRWPVKAWNDAPDPVGWATTPMDTAIAHLKWLRAESDRFNQAKSRPGFDLDEYAASAAQADSDPDRPLYRAHPDWIITRPSAGAVVSMENLLPDCSQLRFPLPQLRIVADYTLSGRQGMRDLIPQILVLLPEVRRFYLVYRLPFTFDPRDAAERAFRIRTEPGWFAG